MYNVNKVITHAYWVATKPLSLICSEDTRLWFRVSTCCLSPRLLFFKVSGLDLVGVLRPELGE